MKDKTPLALKLVATLCAIYVMVTYFFRPSMWIRAYQAALYVLKAGMAPDPEPPQGQFFDSFPMTDDQLEDCILKPDPPFTDKFYENGIKLDRTESRLLVKGKPRSWRGFMDRYRAHKKIETGDGEEVDPDYDPDLDDYTRIG